MKIRHGLNFMTKYNPIVHVLIFKPLLLFFLLMSVLGRLVHKLINTLIVYSRLCWIFAIPFEGISLNS